MTLYALSLFNVTVEPLTDLTIYISSENLGSVPFLNIPSILIRTLSPSLKSFLYPSILLLAILISFIIF